MSLFQTVLNGSFPLAGTHIVQVRIVALVAFRQAVTGIHLDERSDVSFGEAFPVVTAITALIAHVVRSDEYFMSFGFLFPVFDRGTFHERRIQVVVQRHVVAVLHAVGLVSDEGKEFAFLVVFVAHLYVLLIAAFAQTLESSGMVVDYPFQTRVVCTRNVRPHGMGRYADKVQLAFGRLESIAHIAVSVSEVAVVVQVAPEYFQVACRRHNLLCFFTSCHARAEQASRSCQSEKRPACVF